MTPNAEAYADYLRRRLRRSNALVAVLWILTVVLAIDAIARRAG